MDSVQPVAQSNGKRISWPVIVGVLGVALLGLALMNKGLIVAATVNGKPIFSWQVHNELKTRYGQQTLEGMIGEQLILDEGAKKGIVVSNDDVATKEKEIVASLGADASIEDLLQFQGMTKAEFEKQLKLQILVEKLLTADVKVTDAEIENYISTNSAMLTATEPAKLKEQARQGILNDVVNTKLQSWFSEIRQKASIFKFF